MSAMPSPDTEDKPEPAGVARLWDDLAAHGWTPVILRYASHLVLLILVVGALWSARVNLASAATLANAVMAKARIDFTAFAPVTTAATAEPPAAVAAAAPPPA